MPDAKKSIIIITCSIVGCVVTLLTCGVLIGGMKTEVVHLKADSTEVHGKLSGIETRQTNMETEQAFLKGVVVTKLDSIQGTVNKMQVQVDDLMRAE